jgi:nicotinate-nucleotide adenylyltransferase
VKIGILGGTFDPIHYGHLILGEQVGGQLGLDRVIYVPSFRPPHKTSGGILTACHRLKMVALAVRDNPHFLVLDIEIKRRGTSYTVDTLREIKRLYPKAELYFLCGSDLVGELPNWMDIDEIYRLARFVLAKRPGFGKRLSGRHFIKIHVAQVDISSSLIRSLVKQGRSIRYLTPYSVAAYIKKHGLYRT